MKRTMLLGWSGGMEAALALDRAREAKEAVALAYAPDPAIPDFLVAEQAASLGLPLGPPSQEALVPRPATREEHEAAIRLGYRAFVVAAPEDSLLGRFVDADLLADAPSLAFRTFVTEGPSFARRVEVAALDIIHSGGEARPLLSLRGC